MKPRKKRKRSQVNRSLTATVAQRMRDLHARIRDSSKQHCQAEIKDAPEKSYRWTILIIATIIAIVAFMCLCIVIWIFNFKVFVWLLSVMSDRLHIPVALSVIVYIATLPNVTFYDNDSRIRQWGISAINLPIYRVNPQAYLGINLIGGVMPIAIAFYQFNRTPLLAIAGVTLTVTVLCYFSALVVPRTGIALHQGQLWSICLISALLAGLITPEMPQQLNVSVAFTGSVLGSLIGADLLHIKDLYLREARDPLSIGGAGLNDGILVSGVRSLLIAELFPKIVAFLNARAALTIRQDTLSLIVIGLAIFFLNSYRSKVKLFNQQQRSNKPEGSSLP